MSEGSQTITIHQYHHSVAHGDAVSNQIRFLRGVFTKAGILGADFASQLPKDFPGFQKLDVMQLWNADLILLHHSTGNPDLKTLLKVEAPKAIVYHNVTPEIFLSHDPLLAELAQLGRSQLDAFRGHCTAVFGDSHFNLMELAEHGLPGGKILPLFDLPTRRKEHVAPVERKEGKGPRLLFVGRVTPHKNQLLLLKSLYYLVHHLHIPAQLRIVGRMHPIYGTYLKQMVEILGLTKQVEFSSHVSDAELLASYRTADLFVCVSQHEGFCIPLVEAMIADLPILATPNTGITETLGSTGVQLQSLEPAAIAEAIAAVWAEPQLRAKIVESQRRRLEELTEIQNEDRVRTLCLELVRSIRHPVDGKPAAKRPERAVNGTQTTS